MLDAYYAYRALKGLDGGCKAYVKRFADSVNKVPTAAVSEYTLHDAIVKGLQEQSRLAVTPVAGNRKTTGYYQYSDDTGFRFCWKWF